MVSAEYYRAKAQRCRDLAAAHAVAGSAMAARWLTLAAEYETLAKALDAAPAQAQAQTKQQPMQQQQQQTSRYQPAPRCGGRSNNNRDGDG
jgi:hypothetical protein